MKKESGKESDPQALNTYREDINGIDGQIVTLLSKRQKIANEIGELKRESGNKDIDHAREQEVIRRLSSKGDENLSAQAIRSIFSEVISAARSVQEVPAVAYLGPEATFCHQAAASFYGKAVSFRAAESIEDVFDLVEKDICNQGVVPIDNSYEGSVNITLDLFYQYGLIIGSEIFVRIRHHLLSKAKDIKDIKRLYSHHMTIGQCRSWIKTHLPGIPITEMASNSLAAKMAADEPEAAAVSSRFSGLTYILNILEENIEDNPDNVTRFLVIGKDASEPTGKDKTSLLFFLQHKPGALHKALAALAENNVNMARIESRPMKMRNWEYLFFVDIEGHEKDDNVAEALNNMEKHCVFMKRLGSYPAGGEAWD